MSEDSVRNQVFEVIVRQAIAGAPWREICAGPMKENGILPDEIEREVERRKDLEQEYGQNARPALSIVVFFALVLLAFFVFYMFAA